MKSAENAVQRPGAARRLFRGLKSIRFAIILMAVIAVACLVGTLIVQGRYEPAEAVSHYGRTLGLLVGLLGLNHLYSAWWFVGLLFLLALSIATCSFSGLRLSFRKICTLIAHASVLLIVAGAILRAVAGIDGMVTIEKGQAADAFQVETDTIPPGVKSLPLGFKVRLDNFVVRYYEGGGDSIEVKLGETGQTRTIPLEFGKAIPILPDGTAVEVLRRLPHFMMDEKNQPYSASRERVNPAIQVRLTGPGGESKPRWVFAVHPEFSGHGTGPNAVELKYILGSGAVKAFESGVTILDAAGQEVRKGVILVNSPLKAGRYTLYQVSYAAETEGSSTLAVTYDPGVPLVFAGFILLPIGIALTIYGRQLLNRGSKLKQ